MSRYSPSVPSSGDSSIYQENRSSDVFPLTAQKGVAVQIVHETNQTLPSSTVVSQDVVHEYDKEEDTLTKHRVALFLAMVHDDFWR